MHVRHAGISHKYLQITRLLLQLAFNRAGHLLTTVADYGGKMTINLPFVTWMMTTKCDVFKRKEVCECFCIFMLK